MHDLEDRLEWLNRHSVIKDIKELLSGRKYDRAINRATDRLFKRVAEGIDKHSETETNFEQQLSTVLSPSEAKAVYYGLQTMGQPRARLTEVLDELSDWEKVYFFAGVWAERNNDHSEQDVTEIVRSYIHAGTNVLYERQIRNSKEEVRLPESEAFHLQQIPSKAQRYKQLVHQFSSMLEQERKLEGTPEGVDALEATAVFLDRCSEGERRYLTKEFGPEAVGREYALVG